MIKLNEYKEAKETMDEKRKNSLFSFALAMKKAYFDSPIHNDLGLFDDKTITLVREIEDKVFDLIKHYVDNYQDKGFQRGVSDNREEGT